MYRWSFGKPTLDKSVVVVQVFPALSPRIAIQRLADPGGNEQHQRINRIPFGVRDGPLPDICRNWETIGFPHQRVEDCLPSQFVLISPSLVTAARQT